jgi:hypothetical protein
MLAGQWAGGTFLQGLKDTRDRNFDFPTTKRLRSMTMRAVHAPAQCRLPGKNLKSCNMVRSSQRRESSAACPLPAMSEMA